MTILQHLQKKLPAFRWEESRTRQNPIYFGVHNIKSIRVNKLINNKQYSFECVVLSISSHKRSKDNCYYAEWSQDCYIESVNGISEYEPDNVKDRTIHGLIEKISQKFDIDRYITR